MPASPESTGVYEKTAWKAAPHKGFQAAAGDVLVRPLGLVDYESTWRAMQSFTAERGAATVDEIWLVEHPPVYTLGLAGKAEHLLRASDIPVVKTDRGGQITYHGPGQTVVYVLIDLKRLNLGVKALVNRAEQAVIDLLAEFNIRAQRRAGAPGVYVHDAKIGALGFRIRNGYSYHGIALNCDMDLSPFDNINPCGYAGLRTTQLSAFGVSASPVEIGARLAEHLVALLHSTSS